MKKIKFVGLLSIAMLGILSISKVSAQPEAPEGFVWKQVPELSDEFNAWDDTKWTKSLWNYGAPVKMKEENVGVSDGKLWIKATLSPDEKTDRWFESGRVMSKKQIKYPMYTECSMQAAHISAFSTFWMNNGNSKNRDEIDMCESNAKPSLESKAHYAYTLNSQYFVVENGVTVRAADNFDNNKLSNENPLKGVVWSKAYHTIGVWWIDETHIQFYLNGEKAGKVVAEKDLTRDLDIIWDLWTSYDDWVGGIVNKEDLKDNALHTMYVDWIHTYKLEKK